jgi:RNA polymerase sigma factor (sigma-70 family)
MIVGVPPFQRFLDEHGSAVHGFLVASVGRHEADDCFQETFLAALRAYPRLEHADNLRSWALTIAHRKAIDSHRARGRRPVPTDEINDAAAAGPPPASTDGEPALWKLVDGLPDKQRVAVRARFVEDLAYADIARMLGCSEDAARRNVHEGVKKLRGAWT